MLKVAMVDHHLNNFHSDTFLRLFREDLAGEDVQIVAAWESNPVGDDWCAKNKIKRASSPEEAAGAADAVMVMAPDNVNDHMALAEAVLPLGKPTFIDKFLAPTVAEAREIVDLAARHKTPIFSSSALRYANETINAAASISGRPVTEMISRGLAAWNLYGCHTLAPVMRFMGASPARVIDTGTATARTVTIDFAQGSKAVVDVRTAANEWDVFGWSFAAKVGDRYHAETVTDFDGFYKNLMLAAAHFLRTTETDMHIEEALAVVRVLVAADKSLAGGGVWVAV